MPGIVWTSCPPACTAMGGKVLVAGDRVKVSGNLHCHGNNGEDRLPCSMYVERVDSL
ncbi:hypothetical protein [Chondromyces apiculatus]|nr:hypothetical protein [Chondromyces apiculatus]